MNKSNKITFPTYITLFRLCGAPILVPFFIVHYVPQNNLFVNVLITMLFLFFGLTDFLDGFFARKYNQKSELGATLDHVADKFLTFSAFVALTAIGKIGYFAAIAFIGREFFVMALRELALEYQFTIKVSWWGKLKTALHIILIAWLIINPAHGVESYFWNGIEYCLLAMSLMVAWLSAFDYFMKFYRQLKNR